MIDALLWTSFGAFLGATFIWIWVTWKIHVEVKNLEKECDRWMRLHMPDRAEKLGIKEVMQ